MLADPFATSADECGAPGVGDACYPGDPNTVDLLDPAQWTDDGLDIYYRGCDEDPTQADACGGVGSIPPASATSGR